MPTMPSPPAVKLIGAQGQISLDRRYAGRQALIEEQEPGVWLVRAVTVLPDNERWLHEPQAAAELERALDWARAHPADDSGTEEVLGRLADDQG